MNRFGAFLVHLGISLVIFAVLAYLVLYVWYPDFFFASDGGWQGMRIIIFVDLVLGPALTLVVFNSKKPAAELRRDLSIVGAVQTICLAAGTYVVFSERPLALVYVDGQFFSMSADDYIEAGVAVPELRDLPGAAPKRAIVQLPENYAAQSEVRRMAMKANRPLRTLASRYVPYTYELLQAQDEAVDISALAEMDHYRQDVESWKANHPGDLQDYAFFPYGARYGTYLLGVCRATGDIAGLMKVAPHTAEDAARLAAESPGSSNPSADVSLSSTTEHSAR